MPWGGRGYRWMFWLTGLPGWARFGSSYLGGFWRCRFFPWLPRWWWTGMYGPVEWTLQGPQLLQPSSTSATTQEAEYLRQELRMLEEEKEALEREIQELRRRIEELEKKSA